MKEHEVCRTMTANEEIAELTNTLSATRIEDHTRIMSTCIRLLQLVVRDRMEEN